MRTTITLADDVAAAVEKARRERGLGLSEAVNDLVRAGLLPRERLPFRQRSYDLGMRVNVDNIAEVIELIESGDRPAPG
jgi:hypothetical protein